MKYLLAELLLDLGRWDEADELLEELAAQGVKGVAAMFAHAYRAKLAAAWGRPSSVTSSADLVASLTQNLPQQPIPLSIALSARAESYLWLGEVEKAIDYAGQAEAITIDRPVKADATALRVRAFADLAELARTHGEPLAEVPRVDERDAAAALEDRQPQIRAFAATVLAERSRRDGRDATSPGVTQWPPGRKQPIRTALRTAAGASRTPCWERGPAAARRHASLRWHGAARHDSGLGHCRMRSRLWPGPRGFVWPGMEPGTGSPGRWRSPQNSA
jgi:tetratricopeptide (TPR) repeat protein